jgi:hypothetical protein
MGAKKKVLITGAAGLVGGILRLHWGDRYQFRLADICTVEDLGRVYADQHKLSCICVRLTNPSFRQDGDWDPDSLMSTTSRRDCAQIFGRCVDVEDVDFAIVNGISGHRRPRLDLEISRQVVGYVPQDGTAFPKTRG